MYIRAYPGVPGVHLPSACGTHVVWQLSAQMNTPYDGTYYCRVVEDVRYDLPPSEGERERRGGEDAGRPPSAPGASRAPVDGQGV